MSNRHYIKGLKRRAARAGRGRGMGNVAAFVAYLEKKDKAEARKRVKEAKASLDHSRGVERIRAERRIKRDSLEGLAAQDQKRSTRQWRAA